mgnify:CR=1 FL=1
MKDCSISDDLNKLCETADAIDEIWIDLLRTEPERTREAITSLVSYALKIRLIEKFGEIYLTDSEHEALNDVIQWAQDSLVQLDDTLNEH